MKHSTALLQSILNSVTISSQLKCCLLILERYNCRAGEVLSAAWEHFIPGRMLIIKGSKSSGDIIIRDLMILDLIEQLPRLDKHLLFPCVTYQYLYSYVKKNYSHLFIKFKTKKNNKVTHGFRFLNANLSDDADSVKAILNHNSKSSGNFYNKKLPVSKYVRYQNSLRSSKS